MPGTVARGGSSTTRIVFEPPVEFIQAQAGAFGRALLDLDPLWEEFEFLMAEIEEQQFETEGHGGWPELAWSTQLDRYAQGYGSGGPILERTGALKSSLVDPGQAAQTSPMQMIWGTDVEYAHWHQDGGTIPGRPPVRKVIDLTVEDRRRFEKAMVTWINEVAARTFGRI